MILPPQVLIGFRQLKNHLAFSHHWLAPSAPTSASVSHLCLASGFAIKGRHSPCRVGDVTPVHTVHCACGHSAHDRDKEWRDECPPLRARAQSTHKWCARRITKTSIRIKNRIGPFLYNRNCQKAHIKSLLLSERLNRRSGSRESDSSHQ